MAIKALYEMCLLGINIIELPCIGSTPHDDKFIKKALAIQSKLENTLLTVFGVVQKRDEDIENSDVAKIVHLGARAITLVCKSRMRDIVSTLMMNPRKYLQNLKRTIKYAKDHGLFVILDLEHFVDTWFGRENFGKLMISKVARENKKYLLEIIKIAIEYDVDRLVVCDTNGGAKTKEIAEIFQTLSQDYPEVKSGIHCHNDRDRASANTQAAVENGAFNVQTTINGYGERCGNADFGIVAGLFYLENGINLIPERNLMLLPIIADIIASIFGKKVDSQKPFYGRAAFGSGAGIHAVSSLRDPGLYSHCNPIIFGNKPERRIGDDSGASNVILLAKELGFEIEKNQANKLLKNYPKMVSFGAFNVCREAFILALLEITDQLPSFFEVNDHFYSGASGKKNTARVKIQVDEQMFIGKAKAFKGPYNALSLALRKSLEKSFELKEIVMQGYFSEIVGASKDGSGAMARVEIYFTCNGDTWKGVGVDPDSPVAGLKALVMGIKWFLYKQYAQNTE
jgi:2-isopropylmalate synthase